MQLVIICVMLRTMTGHFKVMAVMVVILNCRDEDSGEDLVEQVKGKKRQHASLHIITTTSKMHNACYLLLIK